MMVDHMLLICTIAWLPLPGHWFHYYPLSLVMQKSCYWDAAGGMETRQSKTKIHLVNISISPCCNS